MEKYMAGFGQGFVQATILSENNAVKYRISASGSCTKSTVRPYIKVQDQPISILVRPGLNVYVFNTTTLAIEETKNYMFTKESSSSNEAFITYMDSLPVGKLAIMLSEGKLNTDDSLVSWFKSRNSTAWPSKFDVTNFDAAYTAFYMTSKATITSEHVIFNDGIKNEPIEPLIDVVYDYYSDIGATGFPKRIFEFAEEARPEESGLAIIRLPTTDLQTPLSDYNLKSGDVVYFKLQLLIDTTDPSGIPTGTTRASVRFFNEDTLVSDTTIEANILNLGEWQLFERDITIPEGATSFTVYVSRQSINDIAAARNLVMTETSRYRYPLMRASEFGVNGIRNNVLMEDVPNDELLILKNTDADDRGIVRSAEFREV